MAVKDRKAGAELQFCAPTGALAEPQTQGSAPAGGELSIQASCPQQDDQFVSLSPARLAFGFLVSIN